MTSRRNMPSINPKGCKFRGVRVHKRPQWTNGDGGEVHPSWKKVMRLVWLYQSAGFAISYCEDYDKTGHKVANIDITP